MYYVYVLRSINHRDKTYVGFTEDMERRFHEHNSGSQIYSSRYAPWCMAAHIGVADRATALRLEEYLKSASGKAFLVKHLLPEFKS